MIPDADIVVGGPPCQGFSTAGLRLKNDPRNQLYKEFLRIVKETKVKEFLLENVPEIAEIKDQIIDDFAEIGYTTTFQIVKGEEIGMKQTRHRAFFIGERNE
jgi:DNA (cytosine-5)-methyltransferase 1